MTSLPGFYLTPAATQILDSVSAAADAARQGAGKLLLIPGHRGCGKTFLLSTIEAQIARDLGIPSSSIFRDSFKPTAATAGARGGTANGRPGPDVAEELVKDLVELRERMLDRTIYFKNTAIAIARIAAERLGVDFLRSVHERFLEGTLSTLVDVLRGYAEWTDSPALLLLDDLDHAEGCELALPSIIRELHDLARSGQANVLIVASTSASPRLWNGLRPESAWRHDWTVFPALRPFEPGEVEDLCRVIAPPDGLPAPVALDLARATGGIPALVVEELALMRATGDLTLGDDGDDDGDGDGDGRSVWRYTPQSIDLGDFHRYDQGPQQTDRAQAFIRSWLREQARAQEWPGVVEDLLAAGAIEGDVFTLEAVHNCLAVTEVLPEAWADFDAFAEWVDDHLVAASADEAMTTGRILTDETDGPVTTGTSRYAFAQKAIREYFFGQSAGRRIERDIVRQRVALYAASLAAFAADSPTLARRVSELYEAAEDYPSAQQWAMRSGTSEDLRLVDASLQALRSLPTHEVLAKKLALLSTKAAELSEDAESEEQTLARWYVARTDADAADYPALALNALWHIGQGELNRGRLIEAWQIANDGWQQYQELRFLGLRGDVNYWLDRYDAAIEDWQTVLTAIESRMSALGSHILRPGREPQPPSPATMTAEEDALFSFWLVVKQRLADGLRQLGQYPEARAQLTQLLELVSRRAGFDSPAALSVRHLLGVVVEQQGDLQAARDIQQQVLDTWNRVQPDARRKTLIVRQHLGNLLTALGQHAAARAVFEELLADQRDIVGGGHLLTLRTRRFLAKVFIALGDSTTARGMFEEILEVLARDDNQGHSLAHEVRAELILLRQTLGELSSSEFLAQSTVLYEELRRIYGADAVRTLWWAKTVSAALQLTGDVESARRLAGSVIETWERTVGPDHAHTLEARSYFARLLKA